MPNHSVAAVRDRTPRIALVGCGRWGRNIARVLADLGALHLVVDPSIQALTPYAEGLGATLTADLNAAFSPEIDALAIAAPAVDHAALVMRALRAGKAVFVEKPLALELSDAEALQAEAEARGLPLMVGHLLQYHPAFVRLLEVVREGVIGEARHIISNRLNPGAIRTEENALWSMAPHDFSMVLALTEGEPKTVQALAGRVINPEIPDHFSVVMQFTSKLTAQVNVSWLSPYKEHKLTVLGSRGAIVFEDTASQDRKLVLYRDYVDQSESAPRFVKGSGEPVPYPAEEPLRTEMQAFLATVREGAAVRTDPKEAIPVLRLLRRADQASRDQLKDMVDA